MSGSPAAWHGTVGHIATSVQGLRTVRAAGEEPAPQDYLRHSRTPAGQLQVSARLDPEAGAILTTGLDTIARVDELSRAEALARMAEITLAALNDRQRGPRGDDTGSANRHDRFDFHEPTDNPYPNTSTPANINGSVSYTGVAVGLPGNMWVDTSCSIPGDWSAGEQHLKTSGSGTVSASTFTTPSGAMYTNGTYQLSVHYGSTWLSSSLVYCVGAAIGRQSKRHSVDQRLVWVRYRKRRHARRATNGPAGPTARFPGVRTGRGISCAVGMRGEWIGGSFTAVHTSLR
jgi:hypothetical protein